jgi:hypothetical protein
MSEKGKPKERDRKFRRPPIGEVNEDGGDVHLPAAPPNPEDLAVVMRPLKDLADAFRSNTEALKSIADGQARLGKKLDRTDRSEAVIQSTQALNETFRGVQRTQERLMGRLSDEKRRPWIFLAAGVLVVAIVGGAAVWYLLDWFAGREEATAKSGAETFAGAMDRKDQTLESLTEDNRQLSVDLAREKERAAALSVRVDEFAKRVEELELTNGNLRESQVDADENRREKERLAVEVARLEDELRTARRELKTASDELEATQKRLAEAEAKTDAPAKPPVKEPAAAPAKEPAEVPKEAARDPAELTRVLGVLNRLLSETGGDSGYRFEKIGGIRGKTLYDVVIVDRTARGQEAKKFEAAEARVMVDSPKKRVEIRLTTGHITYYGVKAPFWDDRYVLPLAGVDTERWLRSGLTIFEEG